MILMDWSSVWWYWVGSQQRGLRWQILDSPETDTGREMRIGFTTMPFGESCSVAIIKLMGLVSAVHHHTSWQRGQCIIEGVAAKVSLDAVPTAKHVLHEQPHWLRTLLDYFLDHFLGHH